MKAFLKIVAVCAVATVIGFFIFLWLQIRSEDRQMLRITDIEGITTEVHQPLVTRYISGTCSLNECPYEEVSGLRIEGGSGSTDVDLLWDKLASVTFLPPADVRDAAHPNPEAMLTLRDGTTRKASIIGYELNGDVELANYSIPIDAIKTIVVTEGGQPPAPQNPGYSPAKLQITLASGATQTWDSAPDTNYPIVQGDVIEANTQDDARGGIRLWRGEADLEFKWANLKEVTVNPSKGSGGQPILQFLCVLANGQTSEFTVDPTEGPRIRQQVPGASDQYHELKLEDIRHIVITAEQ
jgi:hypothetical protein